MFRLARDLALYFAFMVAAMSVLSLALSPATLLAVKVAAPWLVSLVAAGAAAVAAVFDHAFVRRLPRSKALGSVRGWGSSRRLEVWLRSTPLWGPGGRLLGRIQVWARVAPFWTTVLCAGLPVPFAIARFSVPLSGYPVARYAAATAFGRFFRVLTIALFGSVVEIPTWLLVGLLVAGVALTGVAALVRRLVWFRRLPEAGGGRDAAPPVPEPRAGLPNGGRGA